MASLTKLSNEPDIFNMRNHLRTIAFASSDLPVDKSNKSELKLWHIALILGIPSAAFLAYYLYYKKKSKKFIDPKKSEPKIETELKTIKRVEENNIKPVEEKRVKQKTPLEKAVEIKNVGNEFFQSGKFEDALRCYSEAISLCPVNDKQELPKFYQNRAAAYENLVSCTAKIKIKLILRIIFYLKLIEKLRKSN